MRIESLYSLQITKVTSMSFLLCRLSAMLAFQNDTIRYINVSNTFTVFVYVAKQFCSGNKLYQVSYDAFLICGKEINKNM